ncbi:carcinoembryonic antigen-related cell adhesion molecule 19-like [Mastomys coucha]|uniref:carcinoembryonic antigen-related cell adhesion molecule 19-like n=1 Tax=Mastomys coucha TaxID=35658 RepID=UPI0012619EAA|nr:carcinoembryonic antigen-related cell adhesion molecule 19-like [Mastomys coucha]
METWTPGCFSQGLLFAALFLALQLLQGSQAAPHIKMIPEQAQKNQDLHGVPSTAQDFIKYLGEEASGGTKQLPYIPGLSWPQKDGSVMGQRDISGFPNGSMLLRSTQPSHSSTYRVAATMNPAWTTKAEIDIKVVDVKEISSPVPTDAGITAAIIVGSLAVGSLFVCGIAYVLVTRSRKVRSLRDPATEKPDVNMSPESGDSNIYDYVVPPPVFLVSPVSDMEPGRPPMSLPPPPLPAPREPQPENQHYQELLNPDPAPYCQLVPTS